MAENNTELQGKIQSCVTAKIKEYNLDYETSEQYLICIIQNFTPGTNIFIIFILILLYHALKGIFHSLELCVEKLYHWFPFSYELSSILCLFLLIFVIILVIPSALI